MGASSSRGRSNQGQGHKYDGKWEELTLPSPAAQATFKWRIDGFSSLLDKDEGWTYSRVFEIMGLSWYLKLNPRDRNNGGMKEYVSLMLELSRTSVRSDAVIEASFRFLIYDQSYGKHHENQVSHSFQTASTSSGTSCIVPLRTMKKLSSGFLVNDSCVFGVEFIKVVTAKVNFKSETLFIQKMNNIFSDPVVYTWDIEDFFTLKNPSYSPAFEIGGHKCFIGIYPSGLDNGRNYLCLYLKITRMDTLDQNSADLVEVNLSIKDQETGKHRKLTGRCQFSKKSTCWGWSKFMSLEDFKDTSKGYLVKTKCCIEAQVAIVGSSKMD